MNQVKPHYRAAQRTSILHLLLLEWTQTPLQPPICTSRLTESVSSVRKTKRRPLPPRCHPKPKPYPIHLHRRPRVRPPPEEEPPAQTDFLINSSSLQQVRAVNCKTDLQNFYLFTPAVLFPAMHSSETYLQYVNVGHDSKLLHIPSCLAGPGRLRWS